MQKFLIKRCDCNYEISCFEEKVNNYLEEGYTVASTHIVQSSTSGGSNYTTVAVVLDEKPDKNGGK